MKTMSKLKNVEQQQQHVVHETLKATLADIELADQNTMYVGMFV